MARSGTEQRRRQVTLKARFNDQEAAALRALADRLGVSMSALIRYALLKTPVPRASRRPTVNHQAVARLLGELGRVRTSLDRMAENRHADPRVIAEAVRSLAEIRVACLRALGRAP